MRYLLKTNVFRGQVRIKEDIHAEAHRCIKKEKGTDLFSLNVTCNKR